MSEDDMNEDFEGVDYNLDDERFTRFEASELLEQYLGDPPRKGRDESTDFEVTESEYHYLLGGFIASRDDGISGFEAETFMRKLDGTIISMNLIDMALRGLVRMSMNTDDEFIYQITELGEEEL